MRGSQIKVIKNMDSLVPSKTHQGGQSAARYERVIEASIRDWFHRIADVINQEYLNNKFDSLIVGGSGFSKNKFIDSKFLNYQIKVKGIFDTGYTNENGIYELIAKAGDLFKDDAIFAENAVVENFKRELSKNLATYGQGAMENLDKAKTIIISKELIGNTDLAYMNPNVKIYVISSDSPLGKEFLMGFKGFGILI